MACKDYDYITLKNWKNFLSGKYNEMVIRLDNSITEFTVDAFINVYNFLSSDILSQTISVFA